MTTSEMNPYGWVSNQDRHKFRSDLIYEVCVLWIALAWSTDAIIIQVIVTGTGSYEVEKVDG